MKRTTTYLTAILVAAVVIISSCDTKREPGKIYMPDMAYSRAVETYTLLDSTEFTADTAKIGKEIFYNFTPVAGTIKRGDEFPYTVPHDSLGLNVLSNLVKNPLPPLTTKDSLEASRLFNINCAICHGAKAGSDGPVGLRIGGVKSIMNAAPGYSDGRLFYIINYGQGNMGSYASQLTKKQRWQIVQYIRSLQPKTVATPATETTAPAKADSTATTKK